MERFAWRREKVESPNGAQRLKTLIVEQFSPTSALADYRKRADSEVAVRWRRQWWSKRKEAKAKKNSWPVPGWAGSAWPGWTWRLPRVWAAAWPVHRRAFPEVVRQAPAVPSAAVRWWAGPTASSAPQVAGRAAARQSGTAPPPGNRLPVGSSGPSVAPATRQSTKTHQPSLKADEQKNIHPITSLTKSTRDSENEKPFPIPNGLRLLRSIHVE